MRETHALLKQLQTVLLDEQVDQFVDQSARCLACGAQLGQGHKALVRFIAPLLAACEALRSGVGVLARCTAAGCDVSLPALPAVLHLNFECAIVAVHSLSRERRIAITRAAIG
jgi:hypothetical protein